VGVSIFVDHQPQWERRNSFLFFFFFSHVLQPNGRPNAAERRLVGCTKYGYGLHREHLFGQPVETEIPDKKVTTYLLLFPLHARAVYGVRRVSPAKSNKAIRDMRLKLQWLLSTRDQTYT